MAKLGLKDTKNNTAGVYVSDIIRCIQYSGVACTFTGPSRRIRAPENEVMAVALVFAKRHGLKIRLAEKEILKRYKVSKKEIERAIRRLPRYMADSRTAGTFS